MTKKRKDSLVAEPQKSSAAQYLTYGKKYQVNHYKKTGPKVISPLNAADAGALDMDDGPAPFLEKCQ